MHVAGALSVCGLCNLLWLPPLQWQRARILGISSPYIRGMVQFEAEPRKFVPSYELRGACRSGWVRLVSAAQPLTDLQVPERRSGRTRRLTGRLDM